MIKQPLYDKYEFETMSITTITWISFAMMCVGMFMAILDVQVVTTSLPNIQSALGIKPEQMSWIQTAYLIAEVIAIPLTGFLIRLLSMRWLFISAIAIFTTASIGCAASNSFVSLVAWRIVQGFSGGTLIPAVFSAVFLLFPFRLQGIATTIAGVLAVLAPTVGPIVGGWITVTYSWHWLFLINVVPGIISFAILWATLTGRTNIREGHTFDFISLGLMIVMLSGLEITLKEAPHDGWLSPSILGLIAIIIISTTAFIHRTIGSLHPIINLQTLANRNFAIGCILSFILGVGLFGSVYLMPVFLAFVRGHTALEIGEIMLITGVAQLVTAPIAVALERRLDSRLLTAIGFSLFSIGLGLSAFQTNQTDFHDMLWPQILRGVAIMFCLLPPTRLALGNLIPAQVPDASGLFNLMRNLGGAIGIALIDTIIYSRAPIHSQSILEHLQNGDIKTARAIGIPLELFHFQAPNLMDATMQTMLKPMVERLALIEAINDAWLIVALITVAALLCIPFVQLQNKSI
jgi:DHA2 family multidrug resistance protein